MFRPMDTLTIELPPQPTQTESNLRRWVEVLNNPELSKIEGRIETDRHGHHRIRTSRQSANPGFAHASPSESSFVEELGLIGSVRLQYGA
jgi:hypothetical protein